MIEINGLEFSYSLGESKALDGLSISISPGKTAIIGPNGSGKTTLLNCISGTLSPYSGEIFIDGEEIRGENAKHALEKIMLIPQDIDKFLIKSTVEGEIVFSLMGTGENHRVIEEKVEKSIGEMGLTGLKGKVSHRLSTGERKKVAMAVALAVKPKYLLVDEPTANLDERNSKLLISLLGKLAEEGISVILTTNNLAVASDWGAETFVMNEGKIIEKGGSELAKDAELLKKANLS